MGIGWIWWACLLGFLIAILIGAKALWDWKRAPYFVLREEAEARARRVALIALALLAANVGLLIWGKPDPVPLVEIASTSMSTSTSIPATPVLPGLSPRTGSPTPAPTLTPSLTFTSAPAPTYTGQVPTPTAKPPIPTPTAELEASFEVVTLARGASDENLPLEPSDVFPPGTKRVYAFLAYRGMERGMPWTQAWYRGGEEVWSQTKGWRREREGIAWIYMEFSFGFPSGEYEVRLYIEHKLQQRVKFTVQ